MQRRTFITLLGSAASWPLSAHAQKTMPVVGFLSLASALSIQHPIMAAFHKGLGETG
jgi:putative tryptophan/tyrosine transport system substrate-binding protein